MSCLKAAVIGVGYLGRFHAQKYASLDNVELVAVVDSNLDRAREVGEELNVTSLSNYQELLGKVDLVSIVVPTQLHFEVAKDFIQSGVHLLLEKPITVTVDQAQELVELAKEKQVVLQVGHLERFNSTVVALAEHLDNPRFIESNRIAPFNLRGSDVNVVLDLMIHDIDIIQSIVKSPIKSIDANGARVLSKTADIANARINFENGCVANVTASRVSIKSERKLRIFQHNAYFSLDLQNKKLAVYKKGDGEMFPGVPNIEHDIQSFDKDDALYAEIKSFVEAVSTGGTPVVDGQAGKDSLETAIKITEMLRSKADF